MKRSVKEQESRKGMKVEEIFAALDMLEKDKRYSPALHDG